MNTSFTEFSIEQPLFFLILIPALVLGIIPFLRLNKKRRTSSRHLIPFIIHLVLILSLTSVLAGITVTETISAPINNSVIFVVDASDSNSSMLREMDEKMDDIIKSADREITKFGLVVFGGGDTTNPDADNDTKNGIIKVIDIGSLQYLSENPKNPTTGKEELKYLQPYVLEKDSEIVRDGSNIRAALEKAKSMIDGNEEAKRSNKRVILMSDGRETTENGDALNATKQLINDSVQVDAVLFDLSKSTDDREVQVVSLSTDGRVSFGEDVKFQVVLKSTTYIGNATLTLFDATGNPIAQKDITIAKGASAHEIVYETKDKELEVSTVNIVKAEISIRDDVIQQNNSLYSWYTIDPIGSILVVEGDGERKPNNTLIEGTQYDQIASKINLQKKGYELTTIVPQDFPATMEELLVYDEIVLMNADIVNDMPHAGALIRRFVEENGRGLLVTCGDNVYDYGSDEYIKSPINDILPVELDIQDEKETVAIVFVMDLSSSMKEKMGEKTRYQVVVENLQKIILESHQPSTKNPEYPKFADTDYIGVVAFDQDYHIALNMQEFGDVQNRQDISDKVKESLDRYYYYYYVDKDGNPTDQVININNDGGAPGTPENVFYKDGYKAPADWRTSGGQDKYNGNQIRTYGTSYKWAIQSASDMLSKTANTTSLEVKQIVVMSDGAPNDQGTYEGLVQRLAMSGTVTSSISIGSSNDGKSVLDTLASIGKGVSLTAEKAEDLTTQLDSIVESVQGKRFNTDIEVTPKRNQLSIIHEGIEDGYDTMPESYYDQIYGYYGTTIKEGATNALYVDNLRPLFAEWEYGNGKVCVFMSDFGSYWTEDMFDDDDGIMNVRLVENILLAPLHNRIDATGLDYSISRNDDSAIISVNTFRSLRELIESDVIGADPVQYKEILRASVYPVSASGKVDYLNPKQIVAVPIASHKYSITVPTASQDELFVVKLEMLRVTEIRTTSGQIRYMPVDRALTDSTSFALVGKYSNEYDIFNDATSANGALKMNSIAASGGGSNLATDESIENMFDNKLTKDTVIERDLSTPIAITALILFLLDIIFRNFVIKKKKEEVQMTDEEQIASMKGR